MKSYESSKGQILWMKECEVGGVGDVAKTRLSSGCCLRKSKVEAAAF